MVLGLVLVLIGGLNMPPLPFCQMSGKWLVTNYHEQLAVIEAEDVVVDPPARAAG